MPVKPFDLAGAAAFVVVAIIFLFLVIKILIIENFSSSC
jgi:hypothetical protein